MKISYGECQTCHETIETRDGFHYIHSHGSDYCGTGDGATAYPMWDDGQTKSTGRPPQL